MTPDGTELVDGARVRVLYWALVAGLTGVIAVFGLLFWLKTAPLLAVGERPPIIAWVMAAVGASCILFGFLWARPLVPLRRSGTTPGDFWKDPVAGARAVLLWVMWEGGAMIGAVGTLMTGSYFTAAAALAGLALLLTHSPGYLASRE
jgi:hypothetical protein